MWINFVLLVLLVPFTWSKPNVEDYWTKIVKYKKCGVISYSANGAKEEIPIGITVLNNDAALSNISFSLTFAGHSGCKVKKCDQVISDLSCQDLAKENVMILHQNETTLIDCSCKNDVPQIYQEKRFNRNFTGTVFSPYNKNWFKSMGNEPKISKWNNYTMSEIEIMLQVLATKFSYISTYGTGATSGYIDWTQGDSAGFVPIAGAKANLQLSQYQLPTIKILQGIYQNQIDEIYNREIENAFITSEIANGLFPGTVQGLIFTSDLVKDNKTALDVIEKIGRVKSRAMKSNLKIGIRLSICHDIIPKKLPEADNDLHSVPKNFTYTEFSTPELEALFRLLLPHVEFIICTYMPPKQLIDEGIQNLVEEHGSNFLRIQKILQWVKPTVRIIGQTGWPSYGISYNGNKNNLKNMIEFWNGMSDWAEQNSFELEFFEAFDEPWKISLKDSNDFEPSGPYGAEGHFGWWRRFDDKSYGSPVKAYSYIPKVSEVEDEIEQDNSSTREDIEEFVIILAVGMIAFLVVAIIISALFWRLRKAKNNIITRSTQEIAKEFRYGVRLGAEEIEPSLKAPEIQDKRDDGKSFVVALKFPYDRKYELCSKKFQIDESWIIGRGNFGVVYGGKIDGVQGHVAFKTLNSNGSLIELKNLLSEIKIMSYVGNHPNIVNLLGAYTAKIEQGEVYVASEYCDLGNLEKYLKAQKPIPGFPQLNSTAPNQPMLNYVVAHFEPEESPNSIPPKSISQKEFLKWAYQIASGMEYIASKKVIHSDLACRNVLLTKDENAKIADFGLSKQLYYNTQYLKANTKEELPWRWMSLESLKTLTFSIESDVWSYGICLWELFSYGDTPYPGVIGWNQGFLYELDVNDYKMDPPTNCPAQMSDLMLNCWDKVPSKRPTFTQLKDKIYELYLQES